MDRWPPRALVVRGACAGMLGGAVAGALDHLLAATEAARFLPGGASRLLLLLVTLYAATGGVVGGALALVGWALGRWTDLGAALGAGDASLDEAAPDGDDPAVDAGPDGPDADEAAPRRPGGRAHEGRRYLAYALALPPVLALHGAAVYGVMAQSLVRFHAHLPIAALVGAAAAGLAIVGAALVLLLAAALSPLVPLGPRARPRLVAPVGWMACGWLAGLGAAMLAVLRLADALQLRPRLTPHLRALNTALWAPALTAAALIVAHLAARLAWRLVTGGPDVRAARPAWLRARLGHPVGAVVAVTALAAAGIGAALAATWSVARLVHLGPLLVAAVALAVGALLFARRFAAGLATRPPAVLVALALLPLALLVVAREAGVRDRVRKAAFATSLAPVLVTAIQRAWDVDGDHYPSSLALGADCDDRDPTVHPGAFDWPDDGIDQNCNGHDATTRAPPRPPFPAVPPAVPRRPNVLLLSIDALRADHVGAYGYARPTTPVLDAVARDAVLFRNGWAHSPSTRYSVPAILIGRYESTIAWNPDPRVHWPPLVLPENRLLSEALHDLGYHTGALTPSRYFEPGWGLAQGFDDYDNSLAPLHGNINGDPAKATGSSSKELADLGVRWLDEHARGPQPFFLWMHFYDPHFVYERHPDCPTCQLGDRDVDLYDGEVRFTDLHIGRVLDAVRRLGAWERTIVIITADHGEGFGEHGVSTHGYHIYAQQNKVPFIVRAPGIAPRVVDDPAGHVDLFPTVLNLVRAPDEPQLLGRSLVDLMLGAHRDTEVYGEVEYEGPVVRKSIATRDWHLLHNVVPDDTFELYDLARDPAEEHDLYDGGAGGEPERLRQRLAAWEDQTAIPADFASRVAGNLSRDPLPVAAPKRAVIGGWLAVEGTDAVARSHRPGDTFDVTMVLHALADAPAGWRLFTHLAVPGGGRFLNLDHEPVDGFVPVARLRRGQWVRDRVRVTLPPDWPAGPLELEVGLWRGSERAPVEGGGDHVVVTAIDVAR